MAMPHRKLALGRAFEGSRMAAELLAQAYETLLPEARILAAAKPTHPTNNGCSLSTDQQTTRPEQARMAKGA